MRFLLERISNPEIEPVTLAEAKRHIRQFVNVTTEDDDIELLIQVAREWVEEYTGRVLIDQTWRLTVEPQVFIPTATDAVDAPPGASSGACAWTRDNRILLRRSPVLSIEALATLDAQGNETAVDPSGYVLWNAGTKWPSIGPGTAAAWPSSAFRVTFRAGFADRTGSPITGAEVVPPAFKHAIKLILAHYDGNRAPVNIGNIVSTLPYGIEWVLQPQKCDLGMA